jgi:predicted dehydrogenase
VVRFGIAGFGLHAVKRLMPGFAQAQRSSVSALSRRDEGRARASAREYGIAHAFTSVDDLCRCPDVDAVFVATPNSSHLNDVLTAVRHRKPVLVEKPMALSADECRRMVETAREAGVLLGVAHIFRFLNSTQRLKERIAAGEIGPVALARSEFCYPGRGHARTWINDAAIGGGVTADVGVHAIDALRFILGDEVVSVAARMRQDEESKGVDASGALVLEFARGPLATVMVSMRAAYRTPMEFVGEKGLLRAHDAVSVDYPVRIELWRNGELMDAEQLLNIGAYSRQVDAFADAVEGRAPFPVPGEEGWQNQVILDAAYTSARHGARIVI